MSSKIGADKASITNAFNDFVHAAQTGATRSTVVQKEKTLQGAIDQYKNDGGDQAVANRMKRDVLDMLGDAGQSGKEADWNNTGSAVIQLLNSIST